VNTGFKITGMPSGFLYGDWTFEGWFYLYGWNTWFFRLGSATSNSAYASTNPTVSLTASQSALSYLEISGGALYQAYFSNTFTLNQWVHLAVVRRASPSGFTVYVNGTAVTLNINGNVATQPTSSPGPGTTMFLGCPDDMNQATVGLNGHIQDARFYTAAKYAQNFTVT
jgi:hypothetical protein